MYFLLVFNFLIEGGQSSAPLPPGPTSETPPPVLIISLTELREITRNFRTVIGDGMFYGELKDGRQSAVTKLSSRKYVVKELAGSFSQPDEEFLLQVVAAHLCVFNILHLVSQKRKKNYPFSTNVSSV